MSILQANFTYNKRRICDHSILICSSHSVFALKALVHLYTAFFLLFLQALNLDRFSWISTLHGDRVAVEKHVLLSTQGNEKSVNLGTLPVFDFCHQTRCEKNPYLFPGLFCFFLLQSCFPEYHLKGGPPLPLMRPCISATFYVCVRLQPNFPKWFESVLINLDHFPWISAAWCAW